MICLICSIRFLCSFSVLGRIGKRLRLCSISSCSGNLERIFNLCVEGAYESIELSEQLTEKLAKIEMKTPNCFVELSFELLHINNFLHF